MIEHTIGRLDGGRTVKSRKQILKDLDDAIDRMDTAAIDAALLEVPREISPEDPALFAARILKLNKEKNSMKYSRRPLKFALVAAVILVMGVTAYAAVTGRLFAFGQGDKYVTIRSNEEMTEQEALDMAAEAAEAPEPTSEEKAAANAEVDTREQSFASVEEAEAGMDMLIPLPEKLPEMTLESAEGQTVAWGEGAESRTVWLNYSDSAGRMFGLTVSREITPPGAPVTHYSENDMDEGSLGAYTSKTGVKYDTLTESDETGEKTAHIAVAQAGEYEYALVFAGFEEAERQQILDSVDLSEYK
jgi:hypothetical protein